MPRDGAIIFGYLIGKLDMLRVDYPKCGRAGQYRLADLLMRYGRNEKLFAFTDDVTAPTVPASRRAAIVIRAVRSAPNEMSTSCPLPSGMRYKLGWL
jgi:hypothetical protein